MMRNQHRATRVADSPSLREGARGEGYSRAFTLIELLVVIIIIAILVGIVAGVGSGLIKDSRGRVTQDLLRSLDRILVEYEAVTGRLPSYPVQDEVDDTYDGYPGPDNTVENYAGGQHARRPDCSVFFRQVKGVGKADDILRDLPAKFLRVTIPRSAGSDKDKDPTPSVVDAWANGDWAEPFPVEGQTLVYYIHPGNRLAQDLYGQCINGRPYFLSAGPDNKYGTTRDPEVTTEQAAIEALSDNIASYAPGSFKEDMGGDR